MRIALDFDNTFTRDPGFWLDFIDKARIEHGHDVYIVTARDHVNDGINWSKVYIARMGHPPYRYIGMDKAPCKIVWCDGRPKQDVVKEWGVEIDIWIDDNPATIVAPTAFTAPDQLKAWRETDEYRGSTLEPTGKSRGFAAKEAYNAASAI